MDGRTLALAGLTTAASGAALFGALTLRAWDREAGRRVAEARAARARQEWRDEERVAELENELEQARERRGAVEGKLREKRAELARLRTEHAALLRRYATAESERASALETRRRLAIEAAEPTKALPATATDHRQASGAPTRLTYLQADQALRQLPRNAARQREARAARAAAERATAATVAGTGAVGGGGGFDFFGNNRPLRKPRQPARPQAGAATPPPAPTAQGTSVPRWSAVPARRSPTGGGASEGGGADSRATGRESDGRGPGEGTSTVARRAPGVAGNVVRLGPSEQAEPDEERDDAAAASREGQPSGLRRVLP